MSHTANQIAFNIIYARALNPTKSFTNDEYCAYRGNNGTCCFVGALIKDEYYNTNLEYETAINPKVLEAVTLSLNTKPDPEFLYDAQIIHDDVPVHNWTLYLENLAKEYNLTVPSQ